MRVTITVDGGDYLPDLEITHEERWINSDETHAILDQLLTAGTDAVRRAYGMEK